MDKFVKRSFLILLLFFVFTSERVLAEEPKKVLILPFEIYSQQDLSYLARAIPEMLTSRLFIPNKIQVIEAEKIEEELKNKKIDKNTAQDLAKKLSADYVIWGSVTVAGEVVSIDAQIMDLSNTKKPAQFFQEIKGLSDLIPQLTRFARKSKNYIEGKEEDFYKEDLSLAMAGAPYYAPGRAHPERGYFGYAPYPVRPIPEEPPVEKAKPRFGGIGDPAYEGGLLGNLVIELSGNKPRVGFAKSEEEGAKGNQTQAPPPYLYYYPPQPYYNYSPPPYYYYQRQPQEEGLLSKMKRWLWPFGEDNTRLVYPQPLYPQPVPITPQGVTSTQQPLPSQPSITPQPQPSISSPQLRVLPPLYHHRSLHPRHLLFLQLPLKPYPHLQGHPAIPGAGNNL
jgi:TolB-like protein